MGVLDIPAPSVAAFDQRYAPLAKPTFSSTPREVYDAGLTSGSAALTSATAAFTSADVGKLVAGLNIPFAATIASVQSGTQATMSANATGTATGMTVTIGNLGTATPAAIFAPRTPGRIVNAIGDSIAPQQSSGAGFLGADGSLSNGANGNALWWAHLLSDGQILPGKVAGIGSQRIDQMVQRLAADILPFPAQFCLIQTMTNDVSFGHSLTTWAGYIRQMCAALQAVGQTPVLVCGPPVVSGFRLNADKFRRWITAYAIRNGFPLVDAYSALADTTGAGGYAASLDSGDGVHPNGLGYRAYGQAIVDALAGHLQPGKPTLARTNAIATSGSMVDNALFLTDSNSDGIPDGWTKSGSGAGVASIVTGDAAIVGNALRLVDTGNSGSTTLTYTTTATIPVGGRFAFSGRIKISGNGIARLYAYHPTAFPGTARVAYPTAAFGTSDVTGGWKRFYCEGQNNTAAARQVVIELMSTGAVDADISVAQLAVHDLSGLGL